jgi:hypothetical protein
MKESQFWALVRGKLPGDVERIENALTRGTPDVNGCYDGLDYWLELKILDDKNRCVLRPEQLLWHRKRQAHGGHVLVLARNEDVIKVYQVQRDMSLYELWSCAKPFNWTVFTGLLLTTPPFISEIQIIHSGEIQ